MQIFDRVIGPLFLILGIIFVIWFPHDDVSFFDGRTTGLIMIVLGSLGIAVRVSERG